MSSEDVYNIHLSLRDPTIQSLLESKNLELRTQGRIQYGGRIDILKSSQRQLISVRGFSDLAAAQELIGVWEKFGNRIPAVGGDIYFDLVSREIIENTTLDQLLASI
jgi:hypothetical protein